MGRLQRSWALAKSSWRTLNADRALVALPVFSFLASLMVLGAFLAMVFLVDYEAGTSVEDFELSTTGYILLGLAGLTLSVVVTYFQAAMVGGAHERLTGGNPTIGSALATATSRLNVIVPWAILSWTVGVVLRAIEERAGAVGRVVSGFLDMAFSVVTFLAVPILVVERLGPFNTLKRSSELFRRTWGENLAGQAGIGIVTFVAMLPVIALGVLIGALINPILGIIVAVPLIAVVAAVSATLSAIYQTALYEYATTHQVPTGFEDADLGSAFQPK